MFFKITTVFIAFFAAAAFSPPAFAVGVSGHVHGEFFLDRVLDSPEPGGEVYQGYSFHSHMDLEMSLPQGFFIAAELGLEGEPGGHDHGHEEEEEEEEEEGEHHDDPSFVIPHELAIDRLSLNWRRVSGMAAHTVSAGKIFPVVGFDPHSYSGIYGGRAVHEYEHEMENKIGLAYGLVLNAGGYGTHRFDASAFAADTTVLGYGEESDEGRQRLRKSDGGLSNTGDLSSFAVSLGGGNFFSLKEGFFADWLAGFSYRFGFAKQANGSADAKDETRFSAGMRNFRTLTPDLTVTTLSEYIVLKNYRGEDGHDRWQSTTSVAFDWRDWTFAGTHAFVSNGDEPDNSFTSFSVSRAFGAAKVGFGYLREKEDGEKAEARAGFLLSYAGDFSIGSAAGGHHGHSH